MASVNAYQLFARPTGPYYWNSQNKLVRRNRLIHRICDEVVCPHMQ